ncbi:Gamma-glutamyltranspeptidase 1 [Chamberlinius hualienensis]
MSSQPLIKSKNGHHHDDYGSVSKSSTAKNSRRYSDATYSPLLDLDDDEVVEVRFVYRKRDAIVLGVLLLLIFVSILATLLIGIPKIRAKSTSSYIGVNGSSETKLNTDQQVTTVIFPTTSDANVFTNAAVSTNCPECSTIAARILEQNGSAVDAAIAATICLSVVDIHHTGLSGGFFMTVYNRANKTSQVIDARENAPAAANINMYQSNRTLSSKGILSVAVPGLIKGLSVAHQLYGRLNWSQLVSPSVALCENGFEVGTSLASKLQSQKDEVTASNMRSIFINKATGDVWNKKDILKQPILGKTLRLLAENGPEEFYSGLTALNLVQDIQSLNGTITLDDLQNYQVKVKKPITIVFKNDLKLYSVPPPGSGALVAFFLNVLETFNLSMNSLDDSVLTYHRIIETIKFMYARRKYMADPNFINQQDMVDNLLDKNYAQMIRDLIKNNSTFERKYYSEDEEIVDSSADHGTSHVSIIAANGDAVSITSTINSGFGAKVMSTSTGIILNNEMDDFSSLDIINNYGVQPFKENYIEPGKRPVSSMCPLIVVNEAGDVVFVSGAAGGPRITSSTAYTMLRHLWLNESLVEATDQARIHVLLEKIVEIEDGMAQPVISQLKSFGHVVLSIEKSPTIVNSASTLYTNDQINVVGDRRGDARVNGY